MLETTENGIIQEKAEDIHLNLAKIFSFNWLLFHITFLKESVTTFSRIHLTPAFIILHHIDHK